MKSIPVLFARLNDTTLKHFIFIVEQVNSLNVLEDTGSKAANKFLQTTQKLLNKQADQKKMKLKSLDERNMQLVSELDSLSKSDLVFRLNESLENRLRDEYQLPEGRSDYALLEVAMIDSAVKYYELQKDLSDIEKINQIKIKTEAELKKLNTTFEKMDESEKIKLEENLSDEIDKLSDREKEDLKRQLNLDNLTGKALKDILFKSGGTLTLMLIPTISGFSSYIAITTIMHAIFTTTLGIALPFAAYTGATSLVSVLSGPVGWVGLSAFTIMKLNKNRKKITQTIMAQIIGLTVLFTETEEEYYASLPSWLSQSKKERVQSHLKEIEKGRMEIERLTEELNKFQANEASTNEHELKLKAEINSLKAALDSQKEKTNDSYHLQTILSEKAEELEEFEKNRKRAYEIKVKLYNKGIDVNGFVNIIIDLMTHTDKKDFKGSLGELMVNKQLFISLPEDFTVNIQPIIGETQPDSIVIHPKYGFRIIEVKNWNLRAIKHVESNGSIYFHNSNKDNPLKQVRNHLEDFNKYLKSNHSDLGDMYRSIGCCVLFVGFTRQEFINRFSTIINRWTEEHKQHFFKYHLFSDQLKAPQLEQAIIKATKYRMNNTEISIDKIIEIRISIGLDPLLKQE